MNAVEIEEAISALVDRPFDPAEFPYAFLEAFGNKDTTLRKLRKGETNRSDVGGVSQRNHIHLATCAEGEVPATLSALRASPVTTKTRAKFILATDGSWLEAEELASGETIAVAYRDLADRFGFFLPLAGISTVKQIRENAFDIKATGRLNKLYVELLRHNPDWGSAERRADMNHFMARLIFCFYADGTGIFGPNISFTATVEQMSESDGSNVHEVIGELFRAMNTKVEDREAEGVRSWAMPFRYVNGELFSGSVETPRFSRSARGLFTHAGQLPWAQVNPDIFGSMIQAVADDEERGALGMHYTSVPNILKVLNPLFLDDLRDQLTAAGDNKRALLNLRHRMAKIRVFDPACGSGNFLVIAYKQMREIEAEVNRLRGEAERPSEIPLTNFRGIEIRSFPAEIARLALIIAEFQCDVLYRGPEVATAEFLPLNKENWIVEGNALRLDWLSICPPTGRTVQVQAVDLFSAPEEQAEIDFENEGGETYICGNPPYLGSREQLAEHKADLDALLNRRISNWRSLDYISGWFIKATDFCKATKSIAAFVSTNSICQGLQVPLLWPVILANGCSIEFAHTSFRWANLAKSNAGVTVVVVGITTQPRSPRRLFSVEDSGNTFEQQCSNINPYLASGEDLIVEKRARPLQVDREMTFGNTPIDGGNLLLSRQELEDLELEYDQQERLVRRIYGSAELIRGQVRYCLWIEERHLAEARTIHPIGQRIHEVERLRRTGGNTARSLAAKPHQFQRMLSGRESTLVVPSVSSESREYLPIGLIDRRSVVSNLAFALYDAPPPLPLPHRLPPPPHLDRHRLRQA